MGRRLADEQAANGFGLAQVFTDSSAAAMRERPESQKTPADREFFNRHYVGYYFKNTVAGVHEFQLFPQGTDGLIQTVKY